MPIRQLNKETSKTSHLLSKKFMAHQALIKLPLTLIVLLIAGCSKPVDVKEEMIVIPSGTYVMGTNHGQPYEGPPHRVQINSFAIDRTEVTNQKFLEFAEAIDYLSEAERYGWSGVFDPAHQRWDSVSGANWKHPEGPSTSIIDRMDHPVIHVSWNDAMAYCGWLGKRLPTEAEWEWAARGKLDDPEYPWGSELNPEGNFMANTWQGIFPISDSGEDGFFSTASVGNFPSNAYGLYDMAGNVWEWTADWYSPTYFGSSPISNPPGPEGGSEKVIRGGSWLCAQNYCSGYRVAARQMTPADSGLNNLGFRCAI